MKSIKVPTPRELPSGNWFIQICVNGKRISVTEPTEAACIARAMAIKQELLEPVDRARKQSLTKAIDAYIDARSNVLSPSTIRGYRIIQRNRFQDAMGRPVDAYDDKGWQRIINKEAKLCSSKTLKNAWGFIASVIHEETGKQISVNLPQVVSDTRSFLEPEQIPVFLEAAKGNHFEIAALLALCSLRSSEISALTWNQVDLQNGIIHVQGAVVKNEDNKYVRKKENKNTTSRRDVPIMIPRLLDALKEADQSCAAVVPFHPSSVCRGINKICESAGLPKVGTHGLRHSFASLAYHLGMPEKIAMQIGGWANDATMRKIYTHVAKNDVLKYQNAMASFYEKLEP